MDTPCITTALTPIQTSDPMFGGAGDFSKGQLGKLKDGSKNLGEVDKKLVGWFSAPIWTDAAIEQNEPTLPE